MSKLVPNRLTNVKLSTLFNGVYFWDRSFSEVFLDVDNVTEVLFLVFTLIWI